MIIGFSGKLGSGKDTAAGFTARHIKGPAVVDRFAMGVKMVAAMIAGGDETLQHSQDGKKAKAINCNKTNGEIQQIVGTEIGRLIDPNVWINHLFNNYYKIVEECGNCHLIIPDVRFKNEVEAIKSRGGIVIRVEGDPMHIRYDRKWLLTAIYGNRLQRWFIDRFCNKSGRNLRHESETALDNYKFFDHVIYNLACEESFESDIRVILNNYNLLK